MLFKSLNRTQIAHLRGPAGALDLVLTRSYGAVTAVILDDSETSENCSFRIGTPFYSEFLQPFEKTAADFSVEIDRLHAHLSNEGSAQLGLLAMMRAAVAMRELKLGEKSALQHAVDTSNRLVEDLADRLKIVDAAVMNQ
jgi:hypothetical protein